MCRIAGCDEPYLDSRVPDGADVSRCTECGREVGTNEVPLIEGKVSYEDVPSDWWGWNVAENRWAEYDDDIDDDELGWKQSDRPGAKEPLNLREWAQDNEWLPDEVPDEVINVHVTCDQCKAAREWLFAVCSGYIYNQIREEIVEHWDDSEVMRTLAFGKLVIWCQAPGWERKGLRIAPEALRVLVREAIPYDYRPDVKKARWRTRELALQEARRLKQQEAVAS